MYFSQAVSYHMCLYARHMVHKEIEHLYSVFSLLSVSFTVLIDICVFAYSEYFNRMLWLAIQTFSLMNIDLRAQNRSFCSQIYWENKQISRIQSMRKHKNFIYNNINGKSCVFCVTVVLLGTQFDLICNLIREICF